MTVTLGVVMTLGGVLTLSGNDNDVIYGGSGAE